MDWGTARILNEKEEFIAGLESDVSVHTMYGAVMGTPLYMPPEQAAGETDLVGPASDTFALGMILFELLEFKPARRGKGLKEILRNSIVVPPLVLFAFLLDNTGIASCGRGRAKNAGAPPSTDPKSGITDGNNTE